MDESCHRCDTGDVDESCHRCVTSVSRSFTSHTGDVNESLLSSTSSQAQLLVCVFIVGARTNPAVLLCVFLITQEM